MPQNTNLVNIHADVENKALVQARIDSKVFDYFFRRCLTGDRGPRQAFITFFYQRFYEACVLEGIAPVWDETNEQRINAVLQRLNFLPSGGKPKYHTATTGRVSSGEPVRSGRTDRAPSVDTAQPASSEHEHRRTDSDGPTPTDVRDISTDPVQ